jgi:hypothetical protein
MTSATEAGPGAPPSSSSNGDAAAAPCSPQARTSVPTSGLAPLPPTSALTRALDLPSFILASLILYWSVALGVLMGYIRPWAGSKRRDDALGW